MSYLNKGSFFTKDRYEVLDTLIADFNPVCTCINGNDALRISNLLNADEGYMVRSFKSEEEALDSATHRHYKGGLYRLIGFGTHTETKEPMVLYEHLWPHERAMWVRPRAIWDSLVESTGEVRFEPLVVIVKGPWKDEDEDEK